MAVEDKEVYAEVGRNYRFFAAWRHLTFAAGVAIWAGVLKLLSDKSTAFFAACLASAVAQLVLLMIDTRTREMIVAAVKQGAKLEGDPGGYFKGVDVPSSWPSHTFTARFFYIISAVALIVIARPFPAPAIPSASAFSLAGTILSFVGGLVLAWGLFISKAEAIKLGSAYWSGGTDAENLKLPPVVDRLHQSRNAKVGISLMFIGTLLQVVAATIPSIRVAP